MTCHGRSNCVLRCHVVLRDQRRPLEHQDMVLNDIMGSTEGSMGGSISTRDNAAKTAKFSIAEYVKVFNEDDEPVAPGSGEMGMVATAGIVPRGYYKDEEKSARTFRTVNGVRTLPEISRRSRRMEASHFWVADLNASTPVVKKCSRKRSRSPSSGTMM